MHIGKQPNVAMSADRFGVSDRATASICSSLLVDLGIITSDDKSMVVDRSKIRRERDHLRLTLRTKESENSVHALYFDGKKDTTLFKNKKNDKIYYDSHKEEHYVIVAEPNGEYITHVVPESGKAIDIAQAIYTAIDDNNMSSDLNIIGCDSTVVNTGYLGGIIPLIEEHLQKPLQWSICLLHTNERPLRHLLIDIDGPTIGDKAFKGPIGKTLNFNEYPPIVKFNIISEGDGNLTLTEDILHDLSNDQHYLYCITNAIRFGSVSDNLANKKIGPLNHSRWLTLASRICRLYVSCKKTSKNLYLLTHFIVTNYAPLWFLIKCKPAIWNGAEHILSAIQLVKLLSKNVQDIVKPVISRNAYFAHSENILLSMLCHTDSEMRNRAVDKIIKIREGEKPNIVRCFRVPKLNFDAVNIEQLINWDEEIFEPPILNNFNESQLQLLRSEKLNLCLYPCHTQSVERCIKIITDASNTVYGFEARDGFIKSCIAHRQIMPKFNTKKNFAFK